MKTIKAVDLIKLFFAVISLIFFSSCSEDMTNTVDSWDAYELKVWDYSDNHYFLDTVYKASFVDYFNNTNFSQQTANLAVDDQSFEVWVQTDITTVGYRKAGMHVDLSGMPVNGYDDSLKTVPTQEQGIRAFVIVRKLSLSEYEFNKYAGYVSLKINLPDNYFAGVAYKIMNTGKQYGTLSTDTNMYPADTLVLKMVKVQNLIPQNTLAWELKLKNIYQLPKTNITKEGFEFDVRYLFNGIWSPKLPVPNLNKYLITILGLDKYTDGRSGPPDNKFDYISTTIDPENGWIIFPVLRPFLDNMESYNSNGVTIDPVYWYPEIYNSLKSDSKTVPNANNYRFQGYISR
jgi:cell surface protein SprA